MRYTIFQGNGEQVAAATEFLIAVKCADAIHALHDCEVYVHDEENDGKVSYQILIEA